MVALSPPGDDLLRAVLVKLFADRQLAVDESLIGYVATRIERSFAAARAVVARLDEEAHAAEAAVNQSAGGRSPAWRRRLTNGRGQRLMVMALSSMTDILKTRIEPIPAMADRSQATVLKEETAPA